MAFAHAGPAGRSAASIGLMPASMPASTPMHPGLDASIQPI